MAKRSVTYDFTPNALFRGGPNYDLNACVGENGGPYDLRDYGQGFFDGGVAIIDAARERRAPVDVLVYPAAFAFRHGIELYLKHILASLAQLRRFPPLGKNHSILEYFDAAAKQMDTTRNDLADPEDVVTARAIVYDFHQIDPTGQVFRYPEDIKGSVHLLGLKIINVEVLEAGMSALREILEDWIDRTNHLLEMQDEMRSDFQNDPDFQYED